MYSTTLQPGQGVSFVDRPTNGIIGRIVLRSVEYLKTGQFFLVDVLYGPGLATVRQVRIAPRGAIALPGSNGDPERGKVELCSPMVNLSGACSVPALVRVEDGVDVRFEGIRNLTAG